MNFQPTNHIVSINRKKSIDDTMVTHVVVRKHSIVPETAPTVKFRIFKDRKAKNWNIMVHKYDDKISELLGEDAYEIQASQHFNDNEGSLRELLKDIDDGVFS